MKNACRKCRVRSPSGKNISEVRHRPRSSRSDHRNAHRFADRRRQFAIESSTSSIRIHRRKQNLPRSTRLRFKRLSNREIESYLASAEWRDKAGGYAIQGIAGAFVVKLTGSYSGVVGLPLHETVSLLAGEGYPVHFNWLNQATLSSV